MFSFYGGKPGNSFVIIKSFPSVGNTTDNTEANNLSMVKNFSKGASYTQVHYGEYVIIDAENKNDPDNGKIFKRTSNYQNEMGGAEYFAQIVGPSGNATYTHFARYPDIINDNISHNEDDLITKNSGEMAVIGHENAPLVPGEYQESYQPGVKRYNDTIKWATYTVRDKNNRTENFYIGFSIPYLVLDFSATSVSPQTPLSIERKNANININHPFYDEWNINIPRAKKGNEIKNIRPFNWADANSINDVEYYDGRIDDFSVKNNAPRWIWVGDYYDYSQTETPVPKTIYLGDYIVPEKIEILNNGRIETTYSHNIKTDGINNPSLVIKNNQEITKNSIVKWPTDIYIDTGSTGEGDGDQKVYIAWNDGTTTITGSPINYILDTTVDDQNRLLVLYSDPNRRRSGGITYGGKTGWTNVGTINTKKVDTIYSKLIKQYTIGDTFNIVRGVTGYIHLIDVDAYAERSQQCFLSFYTPFSYIDLKINQELIIDSSKSDNKIVFSIQAPKDISSVGNSIMTEIYNQVSYNFSNIPLSRYKVEPVGGGLRFVLYLTDEENRTIQNRKQTMIVESSHNDATYCVNGYIACRIKVAQRVLDQPGEDTDPGSLTDGS